MGFKESKVAFASKSNFTDDMKRFVADEAARFTLGSNEAASANLDEMAEKTVRLSAEKNKRNVKEQKHIIAEIKEKKKELKGKSIHQSKEKMASNPSYYQDKVESSHSRSTSDNGAKFETDKVDADTTARANARKNDGAAFEGSDEVSEKAFSKDSDEKFSNDSKFDKEATKKDLDKKQDSAKKEKSKEQKKAASKTSVATLLRAKKDVANDLVNDKSTGNAFADGVSGLLKTFVEFINPMRWVKSLMAKLAAVIAPYIVIFMVVATVVMIIVMFIFSVLQPLKAVSDAITGFLSIFSSEPDVFINSYMTDDDINDIVESITCDETQEKVIRFALSKVGYTYSQENRTSGSAYDCSSLAYYAWENAGTDISYGTRYPPTAAEGARMLNEKGKTLDTTDLEPGDLVYYGGSSNGRYMGIYHVAIYIGDGYAVEALNETYGVVYQKLRTKNAILVARPNK
ncbi:MAG TPA: NlpC/P60 family protein [Lachnospiraceae bacterium]|nr:NlpC/P60 family protein [Lachnospiraceae bacterium]